MSSQDKSLLDLYKLLWEQIKDETHVKHLTFYLVNMVHKSITNDTESCELLDDILLNFENMLKIPLNTADRKEFVQRMIKELEDGK